MAAQWPPSIQQLLNQAGFRQAPQETSIRTNVETGPVKKRSRFNSPQTFMTSSIWADRADFNTFKNFYDVTLSNGSLTFDFEDPLTGATMEWRFVSPYRVRALGGEYVVIEMSWESVP